MKEFIDEVIALCTKHNVTLEGQLLVHPDAHPQNLVHTGQAKWGQFNVRGYNALMFSPAIPEQLPVEIKPDRIIHVQSDYQGYNCPVTGKWIDGKVAHRDNLKRHNCHITEAGEKEHSARTREENTEKHAERNSQMLAEKIMARASGY
jgi:hypothetical protein